MNILLFFTICKHVLLMLIDDNGDRLVGGDILLNVKDWQENRKVLSSPPQNSPSFKKELYPVIDYHRKYWKRRIPYIIERSFDSKGKSYDTLLG